jgi:hypothetical protein
VSIFLLFNNVRVKNQSAKVHKNPDTPKYLPVFCHSVTKTAARGVGRLDWLFLV